MLEAAAADASSTEAHARLREALRTGPGLVAARAARLRDALHGADDGARELAALVLGPSTRPEALDMLLAHLEAAPRASERAPTLRALGLQRNDRALAVLLEIVATGTIQDAEAAVAGLAARRFDAGVRERTRTAARANPAADRLEAALVSAFPDDAGG